MADADLSPAAGGQEPAALDRKRLKEAADDLSQIFGTSARQHLMGWSIQAIARAIHILRELASAPQVPQPREVSAALRKLERDGHSGSDGEKGCPICTLLSLVGQPQPSGTEGERAGFLVYAAGVVQGGAWPPSPEILRQLREQWDSGSAADIHDFFIRAAATLLTTAPPVQHDVDCGCLDCAEGGARRFSRAAQPVVGRGVPRG